jgi:2-keto-4-pentenoate hydratase/2-oxohepta-3-ene-1,7-dioic acid hydratase in catechol pathway
MKFGSFKIDGVETYGVESSNSVLPVSESFGQTYPNLLAAISSEMTQEMEFKNSVPLRKVEFLPPIPNPKKIICAGLNYNKVYPIDVPIPVAPVHPVVFTRFSDSFVGNGAALHLPSGEAANTYDYEGEIVAVIGKLMWRVSEGEAKNHIFGYSIMNEGSVRGHQKHSIHAGKNFYRSGSWGPWIVPVSDAQAISDMRLETHVNGSLRQSTYGNQMLFSLKRILSYLSHLYPLSPGDVIATGSPEGSGGSLLPPNFLVSGDTVTVSVSSLGTLTNRVG